MDANKLINIGRFVRSRFIICNQSSAETFRSQTTCRKTCRRRADQHTFSADQSGNPSGCTKSKRYLEETSRRRRQRPWRRGCIEWDRPRDRRVGGDATDQGRTRKLRRRRRTRFQHREPATGKPAEARAAACRLVGVVEIVSLINTVRRIHNFAQYQSTPFLAANWY